MKKELEGIMGRDGAQPALKTEDGKSRLIYNLFDGFSGKKVKLTIEEIVEEEETEEELEWTEIEEESGEALEFEEIEEETEANTEEEEGEGEEEEENTD
ncbi:hypothetical protein KKA03_02390 [archaeon]|nr:hypothetical protein [archaeon]